MRKDYQISGKNGSRELARFLAANGQAILPDACDAVGGGSVERVARVRACELVRAGASGSSGVFAGGFIGDVHHQPTRLATKSEAKPGNDQHR